MKVLFNALLVVLAVGLTACPGKKDNNNGNPAPSPYGQYGIGPNGGALITSALGKEMMNPGSLELSLNMYTSGAYNNGYPGQQYPGQPYPQPYPGQQGGAMLGYYNGEVAATGELNVTQQVASVCWGMPVGRFQVASVRNGYLSGYTFQNIELTVLNAPNIRVFLSMFSGVQQNVTDSQGRAFNAAISGWVQFMVNGQSCNLLLGAGY